MTKDKYICFLWIAVQFLQHTSGGHLDKFTSLKQTQFPSWLKFNSLDPSPLLAGPVPFRINSNLGTLHFTFRNYGVRGHSDGIEIDAPSTMLITPSGRSTAYFSSALRISGNITYFGEYMANGTLHGNIPIAGEGTWKIGLSNMVIRPTKFYFEVVPYDRLSISEGFPNLVMFGTRWNEIYFENLWERPPASGIRELIQELVFAEFKPFLEAGEDKPNDPIVRLYKQFWQEVFGNTRLIDILGASVTKIW